MSDSPDQTQQLLNLVWDSEKYYLVAAGEAAPSRESLVALAAEYGVSLPEEYLAHASGYWGGLYLEVREEFWPRHEAGDVGPFWSFLYGVYTYALSEEAPDWMQMRAAAEEFLEMGHRVVPCLKVIGDADVFCFDTEGRIQQWQHEENSFRPFDGSFFDLLRAELTDLEDRRIKKERLLSGEAGSL